MAKGMQGKNMKCQPGNGHTRQQRINGGKPTSSNLNFISGDARDKAPASTRRCLSFSASFARPHRDFAILRSTWTQIHAGDQPTQKFLLRKTLHDMYEAYLLFRYFHVPERVNPLLCFLIGHCSHRLDHCATKVYAQFVRLFVQPEDDREGQPLHFT